MSGASSPSPTIDRDTIAVGLGASLGAATRAFTGAPSPSPTGDRDTIAVGLGASLGAAMHLIYDYYWQATEPEAAQSSNNAHEERNSGSQGTVPVRRSPSPASAFNTISSSPRAITSSASSLSPTTNRTSGAIAAQSSNNAHEEGNSGSQVLRRRDPPPQVLRTTPS
ncbi:hypothetical protein B0H14DRAFT_151208 [Mycena olivaceomarginata]|nr:hypothetical protein B0H14DRAFT_151208 [Mycena olivaceomarginata]